MKKERRFKWACGVLFTVDLNKSRRTITVKDIECHIMRHIAVARVRELARMDIVGKAIIGWDGTADVEWTVQDPHGHIELIIRDNKLDAAIRCARRVLKHLGLSW